MKRSVHRNFTSARTKKAQPFCVFKFSRWDSLKPERLSNIVCVDQRTKQQQRRRNEQTRRDAAAAFSSRHSGSATTGVAQRQPAPSASERAQASSRESSSPTRSHAQHFVSPCLSLSLSLSLLAFFTFLHKLFVYLPAHVDALEWQ